jgi:hypothetical protein
MRTVEEPGATSMMVSFCGPKGVNTSHAAAPAAQNASKSSVKKNPAQPAPLLRAVFVLRRAIPRVFPFLLS